MSKAAVSRPTFREQRVVWLAGAGLALAVLAAYHNTFGVPFIFDDIPSIVENTSIRNLWRLDRVLWPRLEGGVTVSGRPVVNLTLALNHAASGLAVWSYHAVNLIVHALAGLTLVGVVRRTLLQPALRDRFGAAALPLALATSALWLLHPLQTGAVTYTVQRAESMAGLAGLLTLLTFIRAMRSNRPRTWLALSVASCLLGVATKEVAAAIPLLVLLYDRTFIAGSFADALRDRTAYYLSLAATWVLLGFLVWSTAGRGSTAGFESTVTPWVYLLTQAEAVTHYLRLVVWPHPLVFDYGVRTVSGFAEVWWRVLLLVVLAAAALVGLWCRMPIGFAAAWFFVLLAPSSSVVPVASQTMAEHRMYLALAGPLAIAVAGSYLAFRRRTLVVCGVLASVFLGLTVSRNAVYASEASLWAETLARRPENPRAHQSVGLVELKRGRVDEALEHILTAIDLAPWMPEAHYNLGFVLASLGRHDEAIPAYERALGLQPEHARSHNNLANSLVALGRTEDAERHYREALHLRPGYAEAHSNYANLLLGTGRAAQALPHAEQALELEPASATVQFNGGNAFATLGRYEEALARYERAVELQPGYPEAHQNLGNALLALKRDTEAVSHFAQAVELRPTYLAARRALGLLLVRLGRPAEARPHLDVVARQRPDDVEVAQAVAAR